uniref:Uncharacterized protein n=1 Tax=Rhabditophanes sp. KR3021 TaxID=114890 RepID=A0AC35TXD1_9BILA
MGLHRWLHSFKEPIIEFFSCIVINFTLSLILIASLLDQFHVGYDITILAICTRRIKVIPGLAILFVQFFGTFIGFSLATWVHWSVIRGPFQFFNPYEIIASQTNIVYFIIVETTLIVIRNHAALLSREKDQGIIVAASEFIIVYVSFLYKSDSCLGNFSLYVISHSLQAQLTNTKNVWYQLWSHILSAALAFAISLIITGLSLLLPFEEYKIQNIEKNTLLRKNLSIRSRRRLERGESLKKEIKKDKRNKSMA